MSSCQANQHNGFWSKPNHSLHSNKFSMLGVCENGDERGADAGRPSHRGNRARYKNTCLLFLVTNLAYLKYTQFLTFRKRFLRKKCFWWLVCSHLVNLWSFLVLCFCIIAKIFDILTWSQLDKKALRSTVPFIAILIFLRWLRLSLPWLTFFFFWLILVHVPKSSKTFTKPATDFFLRSMLYKMNRIGATITWKTTSAKTQYRFILLIGTDLYI